MSLLLTSICVGFATLFVNISNTENSSTVGGNNTETVTWSLLQKPEGADDLVFEDNICDYTFTVAGTYVFLCEQRFDNEGQTILHSFTDTFIVRPLPEELYFDTTICLGDNVGFIHSDYAQTFSGDLAVQKSSWLSVDLENTYGCVLTDSFYVEVEDCTVTNNVYIPNVFSPNGDGINDAFKIFGADILDCRIYDRWGNMVYQGTEEWNGGESDNGTYVYLITMLLNGQRLITRGEVNILR